MKRIGLLLTIEPTWGGAFQYDLSILDAAAEIRDKDIEFIIGYSHPAWLSYLKKTNLNTVYVPMGYWGRFFAQLMHCSGTPLAIWRTLSPWFHPTIRSIIREKCDLWIFPSQDPWCYLAPVPAIATIHDLMHRYERRFPEIGTWWQYSWREWHFRNTSKWSEAILVDSNLGKQHVIDSYRTDPSRVFVLPFIAPSYLANFETQSADEPLDINLPEKFIFYPAQFWEHKNHKRLIKAVALIKSRLPDIRLVLSGAPKNLYAYLFELVSSLGLIENVLFPGYLPDNTMGTVYSKARAMIMPTFSGPTNIPPLEAMKMGCPLAVSNIYAMPEQTRGAALLFNPESVEEMANAMVRLWEDDSLCAELSERGRVVSSQWGKEHFEACFRDILLQVLDAQEVN